MDGVRRFCGSIEPVAMLTKSVIRFAIILVTALLLAGGLLASPAAADTVANPHRDQTAVKEPAAAQSMDSDALVYKQVGDRKLKLFVEKPAGWRPTDQRPAIVFFFGGGWVAGTPNQFLKQSQYFATRGVVGLRVEYRTLPKNDPGPPVVCCADAKSAMRYVRARAAELGINPSRIAAAGGSAGGHLAAFTGLVSGLDDPNDDRAVSCKPDALILFNPVFDNSPGNYGSQRVGGRYREFSPAQNITSNAPPALVFFGTEDSLVSPATARAFQAGMERCGVRCATHFYEGQKHGFFNHEPYLTLTLIESDKFLTSLGWLQGPPTLHATAP